MSGPKWLVQELTVALILAVHTGILMMTGGTATLSGQQRTSAAVLSEHEIAALDSMAPQQQAELLLERAINHFAGAATQIEGRAGAWRGPAGGARSCRRLRAGAGDASLGVSGASRHDGSIVASGSGGVEAVVQHGRRKVISHFASVRSR